MQRNVGAREARAHQTARLAPTPSIFALCALNSRGSLRETRDPAALSGASRFELRKCFVTHFADFGLADPIMAAVNAVGYATPTPIQAQTIPFLLAQRDVLGIAQTGTGKTAAFALPIVDRLLRDAKKTPQRGVRALILAPTRELAGQIATSFTTYSGAAPLSVRTVFGGVPIARHIKQLKPGTDILVATPGRLLDLVSQKALQLSDVEILVLDEADQMLDLGFIHALRRIVSLVPAKRQTVLFSATMPKSIGELAQRYLKDPETVTVAPVSSAAERVDQRVVSVSVKDKPALLIETLRDAAIDRVLVFSRTKHGANKIVKRLEAARLASAAIHGNKSQAQRERALGAFRAGELRVLIATDIAARGLDISGVSHVVNFDLPDVAEQYVHRIGRTGRAGADGIAVSFVSPDERPQLRAIEKLIRRKIPSSVFGPSQDAQPAPTASPSAERDTAQHAAHPKRRRKRKPGTTATGGTKDQRFASKTQTHDAKNGQPKRQRKRDQAPRPLETA